MINATKAILHCSATPEGRPHTAADIRRWHVEGNKWSDIGYHFVIQIDGTIEAGRPLDVKGAHTRGHNEDIGICYVGGICADTWKPKDTLTQAQECALYTLMDSLRETFGCNLPLRGHNEFSGKSCPSFDVHERFGWDFTMPNTKVS